MGLSRKQVCPQGHRGFESHSLRNTSWRTNSAKRCPHFRNRNHVMKVCCLTLDADVVINSLERPDSESQPQNSRAIAAAIELRLAHEQGLIEATYNAGEEVKSDYPIPYRTTRGPFILGVKGYSELGVVPLFKREEAHEMVRRLGGIYNNHIRVTSRTKSHNVKDFGNILEHIHAKRDVFVTEDNGHLKHARKLLKIGVRVLSAEDTLRFLREEGVLPQLVTTLGA